jgi:MFS family permease
MVVLASSVGTVIEWYDFFLYGVLAVFFSELFFPKGNPAGALLISVATFGTGFAVRPIGALIFGHLGDRVGRKSAFLMTLIIMGFSTTLIGFLPTYAQVGLMAPVLLVVLRLLQGLGLGGEYGGAATYIAEHAPDGKRGLYTSFLQTTSTLGFILALLVVLVARISLGETGFKSWGWRIPFLLSVLLVVVSIFIRVRLKESPIYQQLKANGRVSESPIRESFATVGALKVFLLALFGGTAGQAVTWYTALFYSLYFLQSILKVDFVTSSLCLVAALLLGTPFYVLFGALSDRIGRQKVMVAGLFGSAVCYVPLYMMMRTFAGQGDWPFVTLMVLCQIVLAAMVYGPIAAFLVELFPARIRYVSVSVPYHIGNGIFGGFMPLIGLWAIGATGNVYAGLIYPIVVAISTAVVNQAFIRETAGTHIWDEIRTSQRVAKSLGGRTRV